MTPERRDLVRLAGFVAAAVLWAISLTQREDVGLLPVLVQIGWISSAVFAGIELRNGRRKRRDGAFAADASQP